MLVTPTCLQKVCRLELKSLISNLDCNSEDVFVKGRSLCTLTENNICEYEHCIVSYT